MKKLGWPVVGLLVVMLTGQVHAIGWKKDGNEVGLMNLKLSGRVYDHTSNHGKDNRMWSRVLWQRRDLYVYVPPGYDPHQRYPLMIWLHGFGQDERDGLRYVLPVIDKAIRKGELPPLIVAIPDGTFKGEAHPHKAGSFFLNSPRGDYADYILQDVWDFVCRHYAIRCERQAHILAGVGMGGFAAYNLGIKHREAFGVVIGIMPPLNLRWTNRRGHLHDDFHPRDWGWKTEPRGSAHVVAGKPARLHHWIESLYKHDEGVIARIAAENPIEMIDRYRVLPGQLEMYVAYAANDHYNIDAQVESFLYLCKWRGLPISVAYDPDGSHTIGTMQRFLPGMVRWLAPRLAPFRPLPIGDCLACEDQSCGGDCEECRPSARRTLRDRLRSRFSDEPPCGYPHTLPDPCRVKR